MDSRPEGQAYAYRKEKSGGTGQRAFVYAKQACNFRLGYRKEINLINLNDRF